ncbi:MAG: beta-lactamase family protein [Sphingomonadaceae bacterium]|nr:beta-lactamase family protein [Sphingomonadaceae bacterium]
MRYGWRLAGTALALGMVALPAHADNHATAANTTAADAEEAARQKVALSEAVSLGALWLETQRRYARIPAISVAVARGDQTVWSRGFGTIDRKGRVPATGDTIYSICSISKLFTSIAVMQQWEQGRLRLDEPVTTYLPWARLAPDDRESVPVTLRGLLTHSAGLPRESAHPYWTGPDFPFPTTEEIRAGISGQAPLYPASTTFQYSNLGITLAGDTVEAVTGTAYGDYVTANILTPLGLDHTRPSVPADRYGKDMAVGWGALTSDGERPEVKLFDPRGITPAAGFTSSVNDLAKFASWQFRLLRSGEAEVLRASTLREMHRVHYITPDRETSWGLGFAAYQMDGRNMVGHGGSCPGYRSTLMIDPASETAIAVAMNAMDDPGVYARGLGALLANRLTATAYPAPEGAPLDLASYSGIYGGQPWGPDSVILPWAGGLAWAELATGDPMGDLTRLKPLGGDRFRVMTGKGEERDVITFVRDGSGAVTAVERFGNTSPRLRPLKQEGHDK